MAHGRQRPQERLRADRPAQGLQEPTRARGSQAAGRGARSHSARRSRRSGHPCRCCCPRCPALRLRTPCPPRPRPLLGRGAVSPDAGGQAGPRLLSRPQRQRTPCPPCSESSVETAEPVLSVRTRSRLCADSCSSRRLRKRCSRCSCSLMLSALRSCSSSFWGRAAVSPQPGSPSPMGPGQGGCRQTRAWGPAQLASRAPPTPPGRMQGAGTHPQSRPAVPGLRQWMLSWLARVAGPEQQVSASRDQGTHTLGAPRLLPAHLDVCPGALE